MNSLAPQPILPENKREWRDLITHLNLKPSRSMGQNFLTDSGVVDRMVKIGGISSGDTVLEVGPGLGILTRALANRAERVIAIERDTLLAHHIADTFRGTNVEAISGDALLVDPATHIRSGQAWSMVSNLPYSSAAAIVRKYLELENPPEKLVIMLQREVAERMVATPPKLSVLGIATQFYATGQVEFIIPPDVFIPSPKVLSAVVQLHRRQDPLLPKEHRDRFFVLVNSGFRLKRKTIANSISTTLQLPKSEVELWLAAANIDPIRRAETLSIEEWLTLFSVVPVPDA